MTSLTNHETAILGAILHHEAINGSLIQKSSIVRNLESQGFNPVATAIKILELEKTKLLIKSIPLEFNCMGYSLTDEGESYVINNVTLFEAKELEL